MPNGTPAWVTAIVEPVATVIVVGVILALLLWLVLRRFSDRLAFHASWAIERELGRRRKQIDDMEAQHAEARAVLKTVSDFEADSSLSLKLRQQAAALRTATLLHKYEKAVASVRRSYDELAHARKSYDSRNTWQHERGGWLTAIRRLEESINQQEAAIEKMEPALEQAGAAYEKLVRPVRPA